ncbi:hypothetical protein S7711_11542, partial [Stachybotrys chartarum IBT 7711]
AAHGRRTVNSGLWISDDINFKEWLEIFQTDLPARRHICLPDDEEFFNKTDDDNEVEEEEEILDVIDVTGETPESSQLSKTNSKNPISHPISQYNPRIKEVKNRSSPKEHHRQNATPGTE